MYLNYVWIDIPVFELEIKPRAEFKASQIDAFPFVKVDDVTERAVLGACSEIVMSRILSLFFVD